MHTDTMNAEEELRTLRTKLSFTQQELHEARRMRDRYHDERNTWADRFRTAQRALILVRVIAEGRGGALFNGTKPYQLQREIVLLAPKTLEQIIAAIEMKDDAKQREKDSI